MLVLYCKVLLLYFLAMGLAWRVGFESIYAHPTPFYALWMPVFPGEIGAWPMLLWQFPALFLMLASLVMLTVILPKLPGFGDSHGMYLPRNPLGRFGGPVDLIPAVSARWFLAALVLFAILFACAIAMVRGGPDGISQAFNRQQYEYIGDIGKTSSIRTLFGNYPAVQSYLSLHARAAPPGPIALLWLLSCVIGREPLPMSLAVVIIGALGIIPLYYWVREIASERIATLVCLLYTVIPSIALFTATCTEITFMPFLFATLWCFDLAISPRERRHPCRLRISARLSTLDHRGIRYAIAAGLGFALLSILKFTLLGVGAYFAFAGLWRLKDPSTRRQVFQTAALMLTAFLAFHLVLWAWSGFDVFTCFTQAKWHFDRDQYALDQITPRFPGLYYRLLNPLTWFYFAGIPVSLLFLRQLWKPAPETRARFIVFALTLFMFNLLYLGRGEGERSALYVFPFLAIPAAAALDAITARAASYTPIIVTLAFLAFQTWLTETLFYTYW
jgi:hypothetical protein